MVKKHHIERLKKLCRVMESAKQVEGGYILDLGKDRLLFDITTWGEGVTGGHVSDEAADLLTTSTLKKMYPFTGSSCFCGTAACVAGTAGLIPEFRKAGLKTVGGNVKFVHSNGREEYGEDAFSAFFGVSSSDGTYICLPHMYDEPVVTPELVVERLKELISSAEHELAVGAE